MLLVVWQLSCWRLLYPWLCKRLIPTVHLRSKPPPRAHASMALGAADLKTAHMHLQHVVNCLVGVEGKGFDAKAGNPCKDEGQGAMVDANVDVATEAKLRSALAEARHGLQATTLESAHADAQKSMTTLQTK